METTTKNASQPTAATAARRARRGRMFPADTACVVCGYNNPIALVLVEKTVLDEHHVLGRKIDDAARMVMCRNCHALVTEDLLASGVSMEGASNILETMVQVQAALAVTHRTLGDAHGRFADQAREAIRYLDARIPEWRDALEDTE